MRQPIIHAPWFFATSLVLLFLLVLTSGARLGYAADCEFRLGFKALRDQIPQIVGECVENEHHNPENGDALQATTRGLMVWRKADNWTAFTDGSRTWINGPQGLQSRANDERFPWEAASPPAAAGGSSAAPSASGEPAPAPTPTPEPPAPAPRAPAARNPADFVLRVEDLGERVKVDGKPKTGTDGAGNAWLEATFKREGDVRSSRGGPLWVVNRVIVGKTEDTARQAFNEQNVRDMPEAKALKLSFGSLGDQAIPQPLGDEARALGACSNCNEDEPVRHFRIVFRRGNVVQVLYTYGRDSGNYFGVPMSFALTLDQRVMTPPPEPLAEIFSTKAPQEMALSLADNRAEATVIFERSGEDGDARWYEIRVERGDELIPAKLGPTHMYNKVWVANTVEAARRIYREQAAAGMPEATRPRDAIFDEPKIQKVGNESYGIGACNVDCNSAKFELLHERIVFRWGNVVSVIYTWGREDQSNPDVVTDLAKRVMGRIQ